MCDEREENEDVLFPETLSLRGTRLACALFVVSLLFLLVDVVLPTTFREPSGLLALNIVVAQLTLICVWGTLVEGTFWVRVPWTMLLLVISWGAIAYGVQIERNGLVSPAAVLGLGVAWFYGFVVSFVPLKIAAWCFGWRITHHTEAKKSDDAGRYAIRDVMIGTAFLALILAIFRAFVPGDVPTWESIAQESGLNNQEIFLVMGIFSVVSLVVKLPCIWIALAAKQRILGSSISWIVVCGVMGVVEYGMLCAAIGSSMGNDVEIIFYLSLGHMCMAAVMLMVLWILRCCGYSMRRIAKADNRGSVQKVVEQN